MIHKLHLQNFRNFGKKELQFSPKINIIIAPNASGKTNILEALYLTSTGKSFKASKEIEMIKEGMDMARVVSQTTNINLEVLVSKSEFRKRLRVNGVNKRLVDFAGNFKSVLFGPWDLDLVTHQPSLRRNFWDMVLSQVDREYRRCLLSYEKGVRMRNRLLFRIREEGISPTQLLFWNQLLIKNGDFLSKKREEFIGYANNYTPLDGQKFFLEYDKSVICESRLEAYRNQEIASATTLVGPHRDDFKFIKNGKDLSTFGSRGEQRMGVLWLKLCELSYIESKTNQKATLLLDDIFSELDSEHRKLVMKNSSGLQVIITTSEPHYVPKFIEVEKIELEG